MGCKFAIRSGGHNANPGFSSVSSKESGIVLDLRGLKSKALDLDSSIVRLGAGNNWAETFTWLEEKNLSVIGAREGRVGLSGFLLGGMGYSILITALPLTAVLKVARGSFPALMVLA